jgi:hypothetical protein
MSVAKIGERTPEERQVGGEGVVVERLHPGVDGFAQRLVMDQRLARAFEETLEEPGRVADGAAGRQRAAEQDSGLIGRQLFSRMKQSRCRSGHERRSLRVVEDGAQRVAPGRALVVGQIEQRHGVVRGGDGGPHLRRGGRLEVAHRVGEREGSLDQDALRERRERVSVTTSPGCWYLPMAEAE